MSVYTFVKGIQMICLKCVNYTSKSWLKKDYWLRREYALKNKNSSISVSLLHNVFCNQCLFQEVYILLFFLSCKVDFVCKSQGEKKLLDFKIKRLRIFKQSYPDNQISSLYKGLPLRTFLKCYFLKWIFTSICLK